ncbi:MAG: IS5 family transposase [Verrucomicrobiota bacterium]|jgi:IS5 family transposase|nr:IS5 family transposase [Verrucomicrobiota bacterium]MDP7292336.1 IS5 family transposase [Verrucomicrobiota bacterium]HJO28641.1 IS5 family transposase [Candidatus Poseidoniia archaeon]|tara:strand:+ start:105 stop:1133 length:1029 start_codon:yes stop_codon:yes gene_type:complete
MSQAGFFDFEDRLSQLNAHGNPLGVLEDAVEFEAFRDTLEQVRDRERKSSAGRRPYDVVLMFKMLVLQSLYSLSDAQLEYQVRDRISFMAFLGLGPGDDVPDEKTVWLFREQLTQLGLIERLFEQFNADLDAVGFAARHGSIVDASIVQAPRQRNTRDENAAIKEGERPASFDKIPSKGRQKDTDARWVTKNKTRHFGYKNHINADAKYKLIRKYTVTDAATHDSQAIDDLMDANNTNKDVYADSAYRSAAISERLAEQGYRDRIHRKGYRDHPLDERAKAANKNKSKVRARIEHVFGRQAQFACHVGGTMIRGIGITRARAMIGLRNLVYNIDRYARLVAT